MIIDKTNGFLIVENFSVPPRVSENEFSKYPFFFKLGAIFGNNRPPYRLEETVIDGKCFSVDFFFIENQLARVELSLSLKDDVHSWDGWNERQEARRKEEHDKILMREFGSTHFNADWGSVDSCYDEKSLSSGISVQFKNPKKRTIEL